MVLDDGAVDTPLSDDYVETKTKNKEPKKIEMWYLNKTESIYREHINYLQSEIRSLRAELSEIRTGSKETRETVPEVIIHKPIDRSVSPARTLAEMEARDKAEYWKKEIARREALTKTEGNVTNAESQ